MGGVLRATTIANADSAFGRILAKVTPLQRYIAEEIATDHVDGLLSRREALRRLALHR
jgi:carboxymethylenebutenolidase